MTTKAYCTQNDSKCSSCSLSSYRKDCINEPITDLGLDPERRYMNPHTGTIQTGEEWQADRDGMNAEMWGKGELEEVAE